MQTEAGPIPAAIAIALFVGAFLAFCAGLT